MTLAPVAQGSAVSITIASYQSRTLPLSSSSQGNAIGGGRGVVEEEDFLKAFADTHTSLVVCTVAVSVVLTLIHCIIRQKFWNSKTTQPHFSKKRLKSYSRKIQPSWYTEYESGKWQQKDHLQIRLIKVCYFKWTAVEDLLYTFPVTSATAERAFSSLHSRHRLLQGSCRGRALLHPSPLSPALLNCNVPYKDEYI